MALAHSSTAGDGRPSLPDTSTVQTPQPAGSATRLLSELESVATLSFFRYIEGLNQLRQHDAEGHPAYLLGEFSRSGWWQYFPVAFLVKTPTGVLLASLLAAASILYLRGRVAPSLPLVCVVLPPTIYFILAMRSSIDIGVRHILPVYPFLYIFLSFVLMRYASFLLGRRVWPFAIATLIAMTGTESLLSYPHYLAFFNWPSGGSANGADYLLDSNLDWGQDTDSLKKYVEAARSTPLCTALYGHPPPNYFGPDTRELFTSGRPEHIESLNCVVAVSANFVKGLYIGPQAFARLREQEPFAKIGFSIYLYDLR
jgi:hypothetical protein